MKDKLTELVESFRGKFSDVSENFYSVKPFVFAGVLVAFFVFFLTSELRMGTDMPVNQTEFNEPVPAFTDSTVTLLRWEYNPDEAFMEVELEITNGIYVPFESTYEFTAIEYQDQTTELPVTLVYQDANRYVIQIEDVPEDYQIVRLQITEVPYQLEDYEESDPETGSSNEQKMPPPDDYLTYYMYGDYREVKKNDKLEKEKTEDEYETNSIQNQIETTKMEIQNMESTIEYNLTVIEQYENEIAQLEESKQFQTAQEQAVTQSSIDDLNNKINEVNLQNDELEKMILEKEEKIKLLEEQEKVIENGEETSTENSETE